MEIEGGRLNLNMHFAFDDGLMMGTQAYISNKQ